MRRLLQIQGVDTNAEDSEGLTPLIRAIQGRCSKEFVKVLLEREDLDVHKRSQDGRTPMEFARELSDEAVMSLLRKRGALDEDTEPPTPSETGSSNDTCIIERDHRLSRKENKSPAEGNDTDLCANCNAIDLDEAFSVRGTKYEGYVIAELGRIDGTWKARECPMCRLIAAVSPSGRVAVEEDIDGQFELVAFSSIGSWISHNQRNPWQRFTIRWIDTMLLGLVPRSSNIFQPQKAASFARKSGCIGRLGSNCEHKARAITIARVEEGIDFAAAKGWIACCREEHSEWCYPQTLARVPHFRLIDCTTRKIVQQGDRVPLYVALSYVWGAPLAADSGEKSKLNHGNNNLPRDGIGIGDNVEAVVEDAIRMTLVLGYGFLWVDRYCILQEGDGKVKEEQLQSMDLVYANADVTLVATAGQASSSGLPGVSSRCPRAPQPSVRIKGHAMTLIPPDPAHQIRSSAWMTRGWTYQEGLLSRRRLFFSEGEMSFECQERLAREAIHFPPNIGGAMSQLSERLMPLSWIYERSRIASSHKGGSELFEQLTEYTGRKLTYRSDALNAMLGILQIYATLEKGPVYHICGVPILRGSFQSSRSMQGPLVDNDDRDNGSPEVSLAGFVSGLCWTLQSPAVRRPGFPSWSWTGWHGVVHSQSERPVRAEFRHGFGVEVSIVLADGITTMPWSDSYSRLRSAAAKDSRSSSIFSQYHMFDITANTVKARFYEKETPSTNRTKWKGTVCIGDDMWEGDFMLTQNDSPLSSADNEVGFVPSLRRRLLEEPWLGIVLGVSPHSHYRINVAYVLVVQEMPPSTVGAATHWERVGLLTIDHHWVIESEMLEQRKLRIA